MRLSSAWSGIVLAGLLWPCQGAAAMSHRTRHQLKEQVQEMFKHGYDGYMRYAYPADELKSVTCKPSTRDPNPGNFGINDIHPNASLTLLDVLSSLPLIYPSVYPEALRRVCTEISFDQDTKVQVFEMTIRAMGSLLSTYQYLERLPDDPKKQAMVLGAGSRKKADVKRYKGRILELALDLGERMLPAFATPTGLPYARVNLRHGVEQGETPDTCAAGAGSLVLEFAVLSRLTGDQRFEQVAHRAYMEIWNKRSEHDLIGNAIGVQHGQWLQPGYSGIGAGIDSFYEYGMKAAVLLGDDAYLDVFQDSYAAVQTHIRTNDGFIYRPVQFRLLHQAAGSTIDSLAAFFPGLQVLAGDVESAIKSHMIYWNLWRKHSAIPESWVWGEKRIEWAGYPGRPEFVESNYYLYKATKDDFYLRVGQRILQDLNKRLRTKCGFATLRNVETGEKEDRMESFVLSETLKYLYLMFDDSSDVSPLSNEVFTTEGHLLRLPHDLQSSPSPIHRALHRGENQRCPAYTPFSLNGLAVGIERRTDWEYARSLINGADRGAKEVQADAKLWDANGFCAVPQVPRYAFDVVLGPIGQETADVPPEDPSPSTEKVYQDADGHWVITDVRGLKLGIRWRLDGQGYDIVKIGPHRVRTGQEIIVVDPSMEGYLPIPQHKQHDGPIEVILRFSTGYHTSSLEMQSPGQVFLHAVGATATFGLSLAQSTSNPFTIGSGPVHLIHHSATDGCHPFTISNDLPRNTVIMLDRGGCPFLDKLVHATRLGAKGVIVAGVSDPEPGLGAVDSEGLIRPSADGSSADLLREVENTPLVFIDWRSGQVIREVFADSARGTDEAVAVEVLALDGQTESTSNQASGVRTPPSQPREGRVGVGDHAIWNLRIVEAAP